MKEKLAIIRTPREERGKLPAICAPVLCLLLGIALGLFSKWLDDLALDSSIRWHRILEALDLSNVLSELPVWLVIALAIAVFSRMPMRAGVHTFLFFLGMCAAYHLYTIVFSGFDPSGYMRIWYGITVLSPFLAVVCWYGKGTHPVSVVIDTLIFCVLGMTCFSVGWVYFGMNGVLNALFFIAAVAILYTSPKQTVISVAAGILLAIAVRPVIPFEL